jgi:alkylation response protein AidB-like acyl-CoA dehydrogenase
VLPMKTLSGAEEFCEVFFDNVRVPKEQLVGGINKGWSVAKDLLGFERLFFGSPKFAQSALSRLDVLAGLTGAANDPAFCDRFSHLKLDTADLASLYRRITDRVRRGEKLGPEVSLLKIWATETFQRITEFMVETAGPAAMIEGPSEIGGEGFDVLSAFYNARPPTIFGGTNEIQRNIIASTLLGLPSN